jgi:predicted nucleic acid-binding protein
MDQVYVETTIPSYLASRPNQDLIVGAHQQITREWWQRAVLRYELFISEAVLAEIAAGDPQAATLRLEVVRNLPVLALNEDVRGLAALYQKDLQLSSRAGADLLHVAFAVVYEMDFLVTWNCRHIANGEIIRKLLVVNRRIGRVTPLILTPEELLEGANDAT